MNQSAWFIVPDSYLVGVWTGDKETEFFGQLSEWDFLSDVILAIFEGFSRSFIE